MRVLLGGASGGMDGGGSTLNRQRPVGSPRFSPSYAVAERVAGAFTSLSIPHLDDGAEASRVEAGSASVTPVDRDPNAARGESEHRGPRTDRCGPRADGRGVFARRGEAEGVPAVDRRVAVLGAQSNGCLPARKRRTQDVCRRRAPRRVAPSEREMTEKCSTRRVLSRPNPTARWGAPRVGRRRGDDVDGPGLAPPRRRRRDDADPQWAIDVGRVKNVSDLDARRVTQSNIAGRLRPQAGGPNTIIASTISSTDLDGFTRAQKAAEPASRARCHAAWRAVATRRRARLMAAGGAFVGRRPRRVGERDRRAAGALQSGQVSPPRRRHRNGTNQCVGCTKSLRR